MAARISVIVPLLAITLCCIALVEVTYLAFEYLVLRPKVVVAARAKDFAAASAPVKVDSAEKHGHQAILARNIFGGLSGGDAGKAIAIDIESLETTSLGIVLMGTIGDSEAGNRAIILDKKTLEQRWYRQGEEVQTAFIKEIRRGKVILTVNGRDEVLDMSEAAKLRSAYEAKDSIGAKEHATTVANGVLKSSPDEVVAEEPVAQAPGRVSAGPGQQAKRFLRPSIVRPPAKN